MLKLILDLDRLYKASFVATLDVCLVLVSLWLAFTLRLGEWYQPIGSQWLLFVVAPLIAIPIFIRLGLYRAVFRYIGHRAMLTIAYANAAVALVWSLWPFYLTDFIQVDLFSPRSLPLIFWMVLCITVGGSRQLVRWFIAGQLRDKETRRVLIYGAGEAGARLANALAHSTEIKILGFIDDNPKLHGHQLVGWKVFGGLSKIAELKEAYASLEVLLAMPSAGRSDRRRILDGLEQVEVAVRSMPSLDDVALGRSFLTEIHEIDMADLLGREEVPPQQRLLESCVRNKTVMVTGAGGTIGSALCRQIITHHVTRVVLVEHSEYQLFSITEELTKRCDEYAYDIELIGILGTVLDRNLVARLMSSYDIKTVYHAAAYKHVPIVEHNVLAGVRNNVIGTFNLAMEAMNHSVENFVLVSTDKAVRPTNVMGASKRMAEMVLQGLQKHKNNQATCFSMVRFGNVLGSSGSVIPVFKQQILKAGPVTVTHPDITRYFMTIPEAASLILQAGSMGQGGDVFVLDMGKPVKIADLARRMIRLSGYQVAEDSEVGIAISYTGLRDGEKLYEELLIGDNVESTDHPLIMTAHEPASATDIIGLISALDQKLRDQDVVAARQFLLDYVIGYQPQCEIEDTVWIKNSKKEAYEQ